MPFSHTRVLLFLRTLDKLSVCLLPPLFRSLSILSRLLCFHIIFIVSTIILIDDEVELHHSCPRNRMSVEILGTNCDQCWSMVQRWFTSTETVRLVRTESPGRLPRLSHSSWTLLSKPRFWAPFLQTLPQLVTPLKGHTPRLLSPYICPRRCQRPPKGLSSNK